MRIVDSVVAVYEGHAASDKAIKKPASVGFDMKNLSVVGTGYHTEEEVEGFYTTGDRFRFRGLRGAFRAGIRGLFFGGLFMMVPVVGHVIVLGYVAAAVASGAEGAVMVGGLVAIGAALLSLSIPNDSVLRHEAAVKADDFLVMAHGTSDRMQPAKSVLGTTHATSLEAYIGVPAHESADDLQPVG